MASNSTHTLTYLPFVFLVVYSLVWGFALRRWVKRSWQQQPPSIHADPQRWLSSWFPQLIAAEVFVMVGAIVTSLLFFVTTGMARSKDAPLAWLVLGIVVGCFVLFFAGVDVVMVARVRALQRRVQHRLEEGTSSPLE